MMTNSVFVFSLHLTYLEVCKYKKKLLQWQPTLYRLPDLSTQSDKYILIKINRTLTDGLELA